MTVTEVISYLVVGFVGLQFFVSLLNLLFAEKFTQVDSIAGFPLVSILVPARNEEANIETLIESVQKQNYANFELLVYNDESTDKTAQIVLRYAAADKRIRLLESEPLPDGWMGKNHACFQLSCQAKGEFYLFIDADVGLQNNIIAEAIHFYQKHQLALLSVFPKQITPSLGEQMCVPVMNYILLSLLPLVFVRRSCFNSFSAANGQFMFFSSGVYKTNEPHQQFKAEAVEDIAIARKLKSSRQRIACLASSPDVQCRMYRNFTEACEGFTKNIKSIFLNSYAFALFFWLVNAFGFVIFAISGNLLLLVSFFVMQMLTRIFVSLTSKQNVGRNLLLHFPQLWVVGRIIFSSIHKSFNKKQTWKGRSI